MCKYCRSGALLGPNGFYCVIGCFGMIKLLYVEKNYGSSGLSRFKEEQKEENSRSRGTNPDQTQRWNVCSHWSGVKTIKIRQRHPFNERNTGSIKQSRWG